MKEIVDQIKDVSSVHYIKSIGIELNIPTYKLEVNNVNELCAILVDESKSGKMLLSTNYAVVIGKYIGINYRRLSRVGKLLFRESCFETSKMREGDTFLTKEEYISTYYMKQTCV